MTRQSTRRYVALLRGINVGGHNVTMDRLRGLFREIGLSGVGSYIQSGNVFFDADEADAAALRHTIEEHLRESLSYAVPVCLRTVEQLELLHALDPFAGVTVTPEMRLAVVFCAAPIGHAPSLPYMTPDGGYEVIDATDAELFVVWRLANGRPSSKYAAIERLVDSPTTTRFWHTSAKILAAARAAPAAG